MKVRKQSPSKAQTVLSILTQSYTEFVQDVDSTKPHNYHNMLILSLPYFRKLLIQFQTYPVDSKTEIILFTKTVRKGRNQIYNTSQD